MITAFVFMMMLLIEYLNVLTRGLWTRALCGGGWRAILLSVTLGVMPGCLGAFVIVTLYEHRIVSVGALIAAMIASSGDEAFVVLAMAPGTFAVLAAALVGVALPVGLLADWLVRARRRGRPAQVYGYEVHDEDCECYPRGRIVHQWRECTLARASLAATVVLFVAALMTADPEPSEGNWVRVTLLLTSAMSLFIVATVPDHFLETHLWQHVFKRHAPRVLLWTFGALLITALMSERLNLRELAQASPLATLGLAGLVGMIPESGPHLFFVTLYARGAVPFSVLLTSSIVQDGHGMLPLLAYSRKDFLVVKAINLGVGLVVGLAVYFAGR